MIHFQVLAVYTFTKRVNIEEGELRSRKVQGLFTVSHMNIVHIGKYQNILSIYTWSIDISECKN